MVTAEEALKSTDPQEVKRLRSSISGQITCDINILQRELSKKKGDCFDFDKISPQLIKTQKKKLVSHFELVQKLHERFCDVREEGVDEQAESNLVESDTEFMISIMSKVCPLLDIVDQFEEGLTSLSQSKALLKCEGGIQETLTRAKRDFVVVHDNIKGELDKIESVTDNDKKNELIQLLPVESFIKDLSSSFNEVKKSFNKLKEIYQNNDKETKFDFNYDAEHLSYISLDTKLKTYEQAKGLLKIQISSSKSADERCAQPLKG